MRSVRRTGDQVTDPVAVMKLPEPESGEIDIVIEVAAASICGSDLDPQIPVTATLGHEFAGLLADGTRVAVEPFAVCGTCDQCLSGFVNRCRNGFLGLIGITRDGGMADRVAVPGTCIVPLPAGLDPTDACLVDRFERVAGE